MFSQDQWLPSQRAATDPSPPPAATHALPSSEGLEAKDGYRVVAVLVITEPDIVPPDRCARGLRETGDTLQGVGPSERVAEANVQPRPVVAIPARRHRPVSASDGDARRA